MIRIGLWARRRMSPIIAFLASDRAAFITGGEFKVDGGLMA